MSHSATKIAAGVVLYQPDKDWSQRLLTYASDVDVLIVIDNSPNSIANENMPFHKKLYYEHHPNNIGVAAAINRMLQIANAEACTWLMSMDQDSHFLQDAAKQYLHSLDNLGEKTIAIGPTIANNPVESTDPMVLISSGMCMRVKETIDLGGMDEALFIDQVDHFFCLKAQQNGWTIQLATDTVLQHALGTAVDVQNSRKKSKTVSLHSPLRLYYMTRNVLYLNKHFRELYPSYTKNQISGVIIRVKNQLLYGKQSFRTIRLVAAGLLDYYLGRMGKKIAHE